MHLVSECAPLQVLRDDMLTIFEGTHTMRCFMWQATMVLILRSVRDARQ